MKYLRKPTIARCIVSFLMLNFLSSVYLPNYAFALTGGPHQIEYTSYEDPGATDMVNLLTGDFAYNLPILEVPGPEGSFSLPLSYHAGIGLDQEASWVGLGWNMNAGAITRNINEFPDDAKGESHTVTVQDLNVIRGWDSNMGLVKLGWNNQDGHYGAISLFSLLDYKWDGSGASVGIAGLSVGNRGVTFDPITFTTALMTVATWGAVAASVAPKEALSAVVKTAAIDAGIQFGMGVAMNAMGGGSPNSPTQGFWKVTTKVKKKFLHREYKIWLDHTRIEDMYGALYLGSVPNYVPSVTSDYGVSLSVNNNGTNETLYKFDNANDNKGSASDMNFHIDEGADFEYVYNPAVLAYDDYQVSGHGVSGSISPYRLDVGSVSMPREMSSKHARLAPIKYEDYKVPFTYEGVPANSYFHHVGAASSVSSPTFYNGISHTPGNSNPDNNTSLRYDLNDVVLKNERVRSDVNATKKIANGNHIEWLSNSEIKNGVTYTSKFMDFLPGGAQSLRETFRTNFTSGLLTPMANYVYTQNFSNSLKVTAEVYDGLNVNDSVSLGLNLLPEGQIPYMEITGLWIASKSIVNGTPTIVFSDHVVFTTYSGRSGTITIFHDQMPQISSAIGGYVITAQDGTSYHYALPVYDYDQKTEAIDATDNLKRTIIERKQAFANTWLLTAITYPDFIDRNSNGMVDGADWGGWVKLNYGKHSDQYKWRTPYSGYKRDAEDKTNNYTQGTKQLYYLNSIETRSHVALFLKSERLDAIGKKIEVTQLKLDEICLLRKEHYQKLKTLHGVPEYANQIAVTCQSSQFSATSIRDFVNKNAQKRVVFSYSYDLCPGTPNSTAANTGKLTLTKVSIKAKGSDVGVIPDFKFEYGYNPAYSSHDWDAWGLFNPNGELSGITHKPTNNDTDGAAWSLKKITTPLGNEIQVNYERDDYASVSGEPIVLSWMGFTEGGMVTYNGPASLGHIDINHNNAFQPGDRVKITGSATFKCVPSMPFYVTNTFSNICTIVSTTANSIDVGMDYANSCSPPIGTQMDFQSITGSIGKVESNIKGGNLRVGSIAMTDEFGVSNKIRYLYKKPDGTSAGVIGRNNPYAVTVKFDFENWPEIPSTPVMYSHVSVLNGKLTNDTDYHTKTTYEFETPRSTLVVKNTITELQSATIKNYFVIGDEKLTIKRHTIENHTAIIGNLKSIKVYDYQNSLKSSTDMVYTNQIVNDDGISNQGIYSEGTLMFDRIKVGNTYYHKVNKTTILRYAYVLKDVITTKDGNTTLSENKKWDFITGNVLEKVETSALGVKVKSVTVPAYKSYPEFKSKAFDINNKNMLSQNAAEYTYLLDGTGNEVGLLGASAQTWRKDWSTYRVFNSGAGTYADGAEGDQVWRKGPSYTWKGDYSRLRSDGSQTFAPADKYNFTLGATNAGWQYLGEVVRFDHYNMPLESKNFNNIYSVSKMGYDNRIKILSASNAKYTEVAFSSAEDLDAATGYFGGEVALKNTGGSAVVVKKSGGSDSHTGDCAISLSTGNGFVYKPTGLGINKVYRAGVWANSTNGRIYYKLNGGSEQISAAPTTQTKAGNWYLINVEIPIGATFTSLEVGVKSASGTVLFDDFRFQPTDASMVCYVYNPLDFEHTTDMTYSEYVLDNDNLYSRYLYNEKGLLYKTYRESIKKFTVNDVGGEKLISESNSDYRRFYVNQ